MNKTSISLTLNDIVCLSEKRRSILLLLGKKKHNAKELTEKMDMTAHSLAPQLKTLRDEGLIIQKDSIYELTNIGCILVKNMYPLFETIQILEKNQRYWFDRNFSALPPELSERIRETGNYQLLEYDISEYMFDIPAEYKDNFGKSKNAMCLVSLYHPVYTKMQFEMAAYGKEITIIATLKVHERFMEERKDRLKDLIRRKNVTYMIYGEGDEIVPNMTLTDVFSYIYFFNNDSVYDNKIIFSTDDRALAWAKELYDYYKNNSSILESI